MLSFMNGDVMEFAVVFCFFKCVVRLLPFFHFFFFISLNRRKLKLNRQLQQLQRYNLKQFFLSHINEKKRKKSIFFFSLNDSNELHNNNIMNILVLCNYLLVPLPSNNKYTMLFCVCVCVLIFFSHFIAYFRCSKNSKY